MKINPYNYYFAIGNTDKRGILTSYSFQFLYKTLTVSRGFKREKQRKRHSFKYMRIKRQPTNKIKKTWTKRTKNLFLN